MKVPSGLEGDPATARDYKGPFYGAFHIRSQIPLVNQVNFCRDSFLGIKLYSERQKSRAMAVR